MTLHEKIFSFGFAQLVDRLFSFLLMPGLLFFITIEEYAIWSQTIVVVGIISPIVLLGIPQAIIKYFPQVEPSTDKFFSCLVFPFLIYLAILCIILVSLDKFFALLIFSRADAHPYIFGIAILIISEAMYELICAKLRYMEKIRVVSISLMIKAFIRLVVTCGALFLGKSDLTFAINAYSLTSIVLVALLCMTYTSIVFDKKFFVYFIKNDALIFFKISIPFVPIAIAIGVNNFSDRFFIAHYLGLSFLGNYSAVYSIAAVSSLIYASVGFVMYPMLSKSWHKLNESERGEKVLIFINYYLFFLVPFIVGATFLGPELVFFLTNASVDTTSLLCGGLALSIGLFGLGQILSYGVIIEYSSSTLLHVFIISCAINVLLNFSLIPYFDLYGALLAGMICNAFVVIRLFIILQNCAEIKIKKKFIVENIFLIFLPLMLILIFNKLWPFSSLFIVLLKVFSVMVIYFFVYKDRLKSFVLQEGL